MNNQPHVSKGTVGIPSFSSILLVSILLYGVFIAACNYVYHNAFIPITDFKVFYSAALMARNGVKDNFYNWNTQYYWQHIADPQETKNLLLPYTTPPFVALIMIPLSYVSMTPAFHIWNLLNLAILAFICRLIIQELIVGKKMAAYVVLFILTSPLVLMDLLNGQLSILLLLGAVNGWRAFRKKRHIETGLWLSLFFIKPQFILLPIAVFLWKRYWKIILGTFSGGSVFFLLSVISSGINGILKYPFYLFTIPFQGEAHGLNPVHQGNIWSFLRIIFFRDNNMLLYASVIVGVILTGMFFFRWKDARRIDKNKDIFWSDLIFITLLTSLHTNPHDVLLLYIPFAVMINFSLRIGKVKKIMRSHLEEGLLSYYWRGMLFFLSFFLFLFLAAAPELVMIPSYGLFIFRSLSRPGAV